MKRLLFPVIAGLLGLLVLGVVYAGHVYTNSRTCLHRVLERMPDVAQLPRKVSRLVSEVRSEIRRRRLADRLGHLCAVCAGGLAYAVFSGKAIEIIY
jgi:hypothetical protein